MPMLLLVLSLLAAPVEYVAHEGAHWLVARLYGAHATLHFDRVTLDGGARLTDLQSVLFAAAGPAVDWIVGLGALLLLVQRYTPLRVVLAIWVARPLQFLPALLGIDLAQLGVGGSLRGTDEAVVAGAIGVSPEAVLWMELAVAVPLLALIAFCIPATYRLTVLCVLCIGVLAGWAGWLTVGPTLLP